MAPRLVWRVDGIRKHLSRKLQHVAARCGGGIGYTGGEGDYQKREGALV